MPPKKQQAAQQGDSDSDDDAGARVAPSRISAHSALRISGTTNDSNEVLQPLPPSHSAFGDLAAAPPKGAPPRTSTSSSTPGLTTSATTKWCRREEAPPVPMLCTGRVLRWFMGIFGTMCLGGGVALLVQASIEMELLARSTLCSCSIRDFQANQVYVDAGEEVPTCSTLNGFMVAANCAASADFGGGVLYVQYWMPEYVESYRSDSGIEPANSAFSCCPDTLSDLCAFEDSETGLFCDNFGSIDSSCPSTPWPCYFVGLQAILDEDRDLTSDDLSLGDVESSTMAYILGGLPLFFLGLACFLWLTRRLWIRSVKQCSHRIVRAITGANLSRRGRAMMPRHSTVAADIVMYIPYCLRPMRLQDFLEDFSATVIQRNWRAYLNRQKFRDLGVRLSSKTAERKAVLKSDSDAKDKVNPDRILDRIAMRFEKGKYKDMKMPLDNYIPRPRHMLYDTGEGMNFRRMVASRVISLPGEAVERIEAVFTDEFADLEPALSVTKKEYGQKLIVSSKPSHYLSMTYGLKFGYTIVKVNKATYPQHNGWQLFRVFKTAPKPIHLLIEGRPEAAGARRASFGTNSGAGGSRPGSQASGVLLPGEVPDPMPPPGAAAPLGLHPPTDRSPQRPR